MHRTLLSLSLMFAGIAGAAPVHVPPASPSVRLLGRTYAESPGSLQWSWSGSGAAISFTGTSCSVHLQARGGIFRVVVDGIERTPLDLTSSADTLHTLATGLAAGTHVVEIRQKTEAQNCTSRFRGFRIEGTPATLPGAPSRRIEFYGNSITCGYGILDSVASNPFSVKTQDEGRTFAAQAAQALGAERRTVCWSGKGVVQNYNRDTLNPTLPKLYQQILPWDAQNLWDFSGWTPHAVVVNLGTNDFSHVAPDSTKFHRTYAAFVDSLHARYPQAKFVLVDGPMLSDGYPAGVNALTKLRRHLDNIAVAVESRGITATRLSLTPQGNLGYGADYHPNLAQATLNGQELTTHLRAAMGWTTNSTGPFAPSRLRARLERSTSGLSVRIANGESADARIVDRRGREIWSRKLSAGSHLLPASGGGGWLVLRFEGAVQVLAIRPDLR